MPLKLNVGLSKKVGLPRYGSLGAACHLEIELAGDLLMNDPQAFQRHVRNAYTACRQAVELELARRNGPTVTAEQPTTGSAVANRGTDGPVSANSTRAYHRHNGSGNDRNGRTHNGHDHHGHDRNGHANTSTSHSSPGDANDMEHQGINQDPDTPHSGPASQRQHAYIRRLAAEIRNLGTRQLDAFVLRMFDKPLAELSSLDASNLIDTLKSIEAHEDGGDIPLGKAPS